MFFWQGRMSTWGKLYMLWSIAKHCLVTVIILGQYFYLLCTKSLYCAVVFCSHMKHLFSMHSLQINDLVGSPKQS